MPAIAHAPRPKRANNSNGGVATGVFRYPGGKTRSAVTGWILAHRPPGVREYREPFVGGGGVFFAMTDSPGRVWLNDTSEGLVAVYLALRDRPGEFVARCRAVEPERPDDPLTGPGPCGGRPVNRRLKELFDRVARDAGEDPAFRYFVLNRMGFGGRVNYDLPSRQFFSNPAGWNIVPGPRLGRAAGGDQGRGQGGEPGIGR